MSKALSKVGKQTPIYLAGVLANRAAGFVMLPIYTAYLSLKRMESSERLMLREYGDHVEISALTRALHKLAIQKSQELRSSLVEPGPPFHRLAGTFPERSSQLGIVEQALNVRCGGRQITGLVYPPGDHVLGGE